MSNLKNIEKDMSNSIKYHDQLMYDLKKIHINELVRFNIIYFLKENKINISKLVDLKKNNIYCNKIGDKSNFYKYLNGSRTIPLKFIEFISTSLNINYKDLFDINLYINNVLLNYDFKYKYKNNVISAKYFNKNLERNNYIYEQRNLSNRKSLRKLSLELGISYERIRQIEKKQKQLKEQNERQDKTS
jgi:hypothetical protein